MTAKARLSEASGWRGMTAVIAVSFGPEARGAKAISRMDVDEFDVGRKLIHGNTITDISSTVV
ncbi:hypothetical protein LP421_06330 [Rhizobium sp. RCAM05350]|nr:hypothetical protein LP421_06330 [Rhizobium sp. RCAM05350]